MTPQQRQAVVQQALPWVHTPYHNHGRIKGVGVDCAMLLCEVFEHAGVTGHVDPGYYPADWHLHRSEELYLEWLARYAVEFDPIERKPLPGDVAVFKFGRCFSHGAIVVADDGLLCHAYIGRGVILSYAHEEPLQGRPVKYWELK